jgi:hypothetical protein
MPKHVFFSFHYKPDVHRASQVRNIGGISGNVAATDNDWESVTRGGDAAIKRWITGQLRGRSCTVVLVGAETASRKWVKYEIVESWNKGMGVVAIRIHGLKNLKGETAFAGDNPMEKIELVDGLGNTRCLSGVANIYRPGGSTSKEKYAWIEKHLANAIDEAVAIRNDHTRTARVKR